MKNNKWDRNEWQGRRKDQVDSTTNLIVYTAVFLIAAALFFIGLNYIADHAQYYVK